MTESYELPTTPGLYVSHTAIGDGNPAGAVIWIYDADDDEWYEYDYWLDEFPDTYVSAYPEGLKEAARKYGWKMLRLTPESTD